MDLAALTSLVMSSPLLTEPERAYWLQHLPGMTPGQCARLEQILNQPIELPFAGVIANVLQSITGKQA